MITYLSQRATLAGSCMAIKKELRRINNRLSKLNIQLFSLLIDLHSSHTASFKGKVHRTTFKKDF